VVFTQPDLQLTAEVDSPSMCWWWQSTCP